MNSYDILLRPVLSEKSYAGIQNKRYTFMVNKAANKIQIKKAVEEVYDGVTVEKVRTMNCRGKLKRQGKTQGYTPSYKKAIVQLTESSKTIADFESLA